MKKILIVSIHFDPFSTRAIENFEFLINNSKSKFEIHYFNRLKSSTRSKSSKNNGIYIGNENPNIFDLFQFCLNLAYHLLKNPHYNLLVVDDLASYGGFSTIIAKSLKIKVMITVHGFFLLEWKNRAKFPIFKEMISQIISRISFRYADMFVINDNRMRELFLHNKINPTKIWERYVCVDPIKFDRYIIDKDISIDYYNKYHLFEEYVLFVGNLSKGDGIEDFLEIIQRIYVIYPNISYVIVGRGPLQSQLKNFINQNTQFKIKYIDHIDFHYMPLVYANAILTVLPMYPPQAGVGKIILESLSMECPVITTDAGIFHEVIQDDINGYIVHVGDIYSFVIKIIDLIQNQEKRVRLGKNGRKTILGKYSIDSYIENWNSSINFILNERIL